MALMSSASSQGSSKHVSVLYVAMIACSLPYVLSVIGSLLLAAPHWKYIVPTCVSLSFLFFNLSSCLLPPRASLSSYSLHPGCFAAGVGLNPETSQAEEDVPRKIKRDRESAGVV